MMQQIRACKRTWHNNGPPLLRIDGDLAQAETHGTGATVSEQLEGKWLGGGAQEFMLGVAQVFKDAGSIPEALDSYEDNVDASYLEAAGAM